MKEITRIHLAKIPYEIELDAKKNLQKYLDALRKYSDEEIFEDVEIRITEILAESGISKHGIISEKEVQKIRAQIGEPEIFKGEDFEEETSSEKSSTNFEAEKLPKKLYRDRQNQMVAGVLAGIAGYFEIDATVVRLAFVLLTFFSFGTTFLIYLILAIIIPPAKNSSDILRLRGQKISANSIKEINKEYDFERFDRQDRFVGRILAGIGGGIALMMALCGVAALIFGNFALNEFFKQPEARGFYGTALLILSNIAGLAFVAFCANLAFAGFSYKIRRSQIVSLIILAVLGVVCGSGMMISVSQLGMEYQERQERISSSLTTKEVKFDAEKLSQIKNLKVGNFTNVEYIVSDERKVEFSEFEALKENKFEKVKVEFNGENMKIDLPISRAYPYSSEEKIRIYGPELSKIELGESARVEYEKLSQSNLEIFQRQSSTFEFDGKTIDNLKVSQDYASTIDSSDVFVKNLVAKSRGGNVRLKSVENAIFETVDCTNDSSRVVYLSLEENAKNAKITLNGSEFNASRTGECFMLHGDELDF